MFVLSAHRRSCAHNCLPGSESLSSDGARLETKITNPRKVKGSPPQLHLTGPFSILSEAAELDQCVLAREKAEV